MAIFRFEAKIISRNGGHSSTVGAAAYQSGKCATSAAAYRAGAEMTDERTGQSFDYSNKKGVLGAEIRLPAGAPDWMADRSRLWNAVEAIEKRRDSQLARDFIISLPHELTHEQRRALLEEFVDKHLTSRGYVADCAYHAPPKGDDLNWHAHVMVPMRKVNEDGFARKKERPEGNPRAAWRAELEALREDWAAHVNRHLEAAGIETRIDHRSNAAQGIDREPEPKLGPMAAKIEAEGRVSHAGNDLRDARARNAERGRLKGEMAGLTAEIIDLQAERDKRMREQQAAPSEIDPAVYAKQRNTLVDERIRVIEAQANQQRAGQERMREEMNRKNQQQAEEAQKHEADRKRQQETAAANGDITDPALRYAEALGRNYSVKDPYGSLANAAMAEYGAFAKQQQELKFKANAEQDPTKKQLLELQAKIEGADYMRVTSHRLGGMSDVIAGRRQSEQGERDREAAQLWKERGEELRAERAEALRQQREADEKRDRTPEPGRSSGTGRGHDSSSGRREQPDRSEEKSDRQQTRDSGDRTQTSGGERGTGGQGRAVGQGGGRGR